MSKIIKNLSDLNHFTFLSSIDEYVHKQTRKLHPFVKAIKESDYKMLAKYLKSEDEWTLYDGIVFACHFNKPSVALFLIKNGVDVNLKKKNDDNLEWDERMKVMGHAIGYRHYDVIKALLEKGVNIDDVYHDRYFSNHAINIYYSIHDYCPNIDILKLLLDNRAKVDVSQKSLFMIGTRAPSEELKLLLDHKFNSNSILVESKRKKDYVNETYHDVEINLLDIAIINANNKNLFGRDDDSIKKVGMLLDYGANHLNTKNDCEQNYLHISTVPDVIEMLCKKGCDVNQIALFDQFSSRYGFVKPIDITVDEKIKTILLRYGATLSELTKEEKEVITINDFKHITTYNIKTFIKNITDDKEFVNQCNENGWGLLHYLFANFNDDSISDVYDTESLSSNRTLKMINISIKSGAEPTKDKIGRTPLMCMTFHPFAKLVPTVIIMYSDFEADYYGLNREEYLKKLFVLRSGGFKEVATIVGSRCAPLKHIFDDFWASFKNGKEFKPKKSLDSVASWNKMAELLG